ncbi:hypothetical protein HG537_0E01720 [Torulaspora globosa]|uniref:Pex19-domain-containing protein n=1 Tax=Torulaspora globosa TaxID=48254 RepID=A0A7H9HVN0_9SACH|nr:hypothetical protein HG537_0E01720 [Torulaspora sp. CBS 2947]
MDAEEEYDELDDLLDEDPSKLETGATSEGSSEDAGKPVNGVEEVEDPEVKEMMDDLQQEFSNLMKDGGMDEQAKAEQAENFQRILGMLGDASKTSVKSDSGSREPQGFKNVVSKTLDRLKENGSKVDSNLAKEEKQKNTDDILSQLLDQLVESGNVGDTQGSEDGVDNAILQILNQMSSKEVLYQPMKEMHAEFTQWLQDHSEDEEHTDKIDIYKKQYHLVGQIIAVFENDSYTNETNREQITNLLDELEQLGDSPVSKGFNNANENNELDDFAKMLEIDGDDKNLGNLDKELQDTCKQQ